LESGVVGTQWGNSLARVARHKTRKKGTQKTWTVEGTQGVESCR